MALRIDGMHREDIKALIRKQHGSISAFERLNGLPAKSVSDYFRGRTSKRVRRAICRIVDREFPNAVSPASESQKTELAPTNSWPSKILNILAQWRRS